MRLRTPRLGGWTPAIGLAATLLASPPVILARQDLPAARAVVDRFVDAIGGRAAFKAMKSIHARGRLEVAAQQIAGDLELYTARPAKMLYRVDVPGVGRIEHAYNGTIGWSLSPVTGPELLTGRQLSEAADEAWFDGPLHEPERVRELTTTGKGEFDGQPAYIVKVVQNSGHEQIEYYAIESGLLLGSESDQATPQGIIHTTNILRNYRQFGPLMQATSFVQRALGFEQTVTIASVEYDTVPDSVFEPPAEVNALLPK